MLSRRLPLIPWDLGEGWHTVPRLPLFLWNAATEECLRLPPPPPPPLLSFSVLLESGESSSATEDCVSSGSTTDSSSIISGMAGSLKASLNNRKRGMDEFDYCSLFYMTFQDWLTNTAWELKCINLFWFIQQSCSIGCADTTMFILSAIILIIIHAAETKPSIVQICYMWIEM